MTYLEIARGVIQKRAAARERPAAQPAIETQPISLENDLRGGAIELWSTATGRLFLVADEADARFAMEQFGARRGEIYTAAEARRVIAVKDSAVAAEIHEWKRQFDGAVREFRPGDAK